MARATATQAASAHLAVPASVHDLSASSRARVFHPSAEVGCRQVARRTGAELPRPTCVVQMILARWTAHLPTVKQLLDSRVRALWMCMHKT